MGQRFSRDNLGVFEGWRGDFLREADLEKQLIAEVEKLGGKAFKFTSPGNRGVPDRIILLNGKACFAELKAPGKKLRPIQQYRKRQLENLGFTVYVVDSVDSLEVMVDELEGGDLFHG